MKAASPSAGKLPRVRHLSIAVHEALRNISYAGRSIHTRGLTSSMLAASGGALLASALTVLPAAPAAAQDQAAQQQQAAQKVEEITVTGSRIRRRDFTSNSPIVTIDATNFSATSAIGAETVLNRLPEFTPAVTQFTTADVQQSATNTVGASTVSLRGLGPNRNLVLVDGHRAMPTGPTMVVDTNSIPSAAIQRVEIISGGASAVYGADAVGGVVNFILKDNFEGTNVNVRYGDTEHGGGAETSISALLGANVMGDRGNVMMGVERATRTKEYTWQRDWRVADFANPSTGTFAFFGSDTYVSNEYNPAAFFDTNAPSQAEVNTLFNKLPAGTIKSGTLGFGGTNFFVNRSDGTIYTGLMTSNDAQASGSYRYNGPLYPQTTGDYYGANQGLPFRVQQPNGNIKENDLYSWSSSPLERLSTFANASFALSDNVKLTSRAMLSRTETQSSLGLTAANVTLWGAKVPFGSEIYHGNPRYGVPDSLNPNGTTNPAYTINGRFGVDCDGPPTPEKPWLDGKPGCTMSEAWPTTAEVYNLFMTRPDPNAPIWVNRAPDYLRNALGAGRSSTDKTTTMQFSLGLEGNFGASQNWDVTVSTGRTDNEADLLGSVRLSTYRDLFLTPNYGRNAVFDPNPYGTGFAESVPTCTSGLPIFGNGALSADCAAMISPGLKNNTSVKQSVVEANLTGDLAKMPAGSLQYALGTDYREDSYAFTPDNLTDLQNEIDPIAGIFPQGPSGGKFDVTELYGELVIPVVNNGPTGVKHFEFDLGGRASDWSMDQVGTLGSFKAQIDWTVTPHYRIRGGFNRAFRAPNLGELYQGRTTAFAFGGANFGDHCSQNLDAPSPYGATPGGGASAEQIAQTLKICRALMGVTGAAEYYDNRALAEQPTGGGLGIPANFGNPDVQEEKADTFTLGVVMNMAANTTLTVDYYTIEIKNMIALAPGDATYQRCLSLEFNPTGD
ncbi:MAG TPA: TonB-dependent receptor, partial [Gammaproteobacteria bacterium]|nr:TonB-dependent receptor [Gammaproteobacteria bacterium]